MSHSAPAIFCWQSGSFAFICDWESCPTTSISDFFPFLTPQDSSGALVDKSADTHDGCTLIVRLAYQQEMVTPWGSRYYANILAKATALRINLDIYGALIASRAHAHPSHSQTFRLLLFPIIKNVQEIAIVLLIFCMNKFDNSYSVQVGQVYEN